MKSVGSEEGNDGRDSTRVGMILAFVFVSTFLLPGAGEARAQHAQPANAGDFLLIPLEGLPAAGAFGAAIATLPNGNFVVVDPLHDADDGKDVGSVTLYDGDALRVISRTFGVTAQSQIGSGGIVVLDDGNFVIASPLFGLEGAAQVGAVTLCSAETGCPSHVTPENSLTGSTAGDHVGARVVAIGEGGYVVQSPHWRHAGVDDAGAVTRCNPAQVCAGAVVGAENSLVGGASGDNVGQDEVTILANGDYVVAAPAWDLGALSDVGAVRRCPVSGNPCAGHFSNANALIGAAASDKIGSGGVRALDEGYVVASPSYNLGAIADVGAVTLCLDACAGAVTSDNSLVGSHAHDNLGGGGITVVDGGSAYVIASPLWDASAANDVGAVTYCRIDAPCAGDDVEGRSLHGTQSGDQVGGAGVTALASGDYVVASPAWANGASQVGAVTLCGGATGCQGLAVATTNSVYGSTANDRVGSSGVTALEGGGYVVGSPMWDSAGAADVGAVTWCSALGCIAAPVSLANSVVVTNTLDGVATAIALSNGNYVVSAPLFNVGALSDAGKALLCDGEAGCLGPMSALAGIAGSAAGQHVGRAVLALANGNFLVRSAHTGAGVPANAGAVTWCSGTTGCPGQVSALNSVVGARTGDALGSGGMLALGNGDALLLSQMADSATRSDAGAITWMRGDAATGGTMESLPTIYGGVSGAGAMLTWAFNNTFGYLVGGLPAQNKVVVLMARPSLFVVLAGSGNGAVTSSSGDIDCGDDCLEDASLGATVTLTATPAANSDFAGWSGACSGAGTCEVSVQGATLVTATFAVKMVALTLPESFEGGEVAVAVVAPPGGAKEASGRLDDVLSARAAVDAVYAYGTVLKLTAVSDSNHVFVAWTGDLSGKENPVQFTLTEPLTIGATFRSVDAPDPELDIFLPLITQQD